MNPSPSLTLLLLAAGLGSRYGGLKQMDPIGPNGETFIDYSVYDALRSGFNKIVFVIRKDIEKPFRESIGARFEDRVAVEYAFQELDQLPRGLSVPAGRTKPWGTAQAVLSAAGVIHEPFVVINADDFYGAESYRLLSQHLTEQTGDYAMAGFILRNTLSEHGSVARGICTLSTEGLLQNVVEMTSIHRETDGIVNIPPEGIRTPLTGDEIVSMNIWGLTPRIFPQLEEYFQRFLEEHGSELRSECYLPSAINNLLQTGKARVRVLPTHASWLGVTYRDDRAHVLDGIADLIRAGDYPERLWT
jgi:UTP-glucose-1-phosphate uridylyltransferase